MSNANSGSVSGNQPSLNEAGPSSDDFAKRKQRIMIMLLGYAVLLGLVYAVVWGEEGPVEDDPAVDFVVFLPLLILSVLWCHADANERNHRIGRFMGLALVFLFGVAFPIYLFRTRGISGFKTLGLATLFATAMFACYFAVAMSTMCILHFGEFVDWPLE
jgi:hypothetical protein